MIVEVTEEWRAVATSGRIVATFTERELAENWRATHQQHKVTMKSVVTIVIEEEAHGLR